MKRFLFQLVNLLMACVVLLSSTGFGLVEHSCQLRGKKKTMVVAFSKATTPGCQSGKHIATAASNRPAVDREPCCQDEQHYENVDVNSSLTQWIAKFVKIVTETVLAGVSIVVTWLVDWSVDRDATSGPPSVSDPPLPAGRDLLSLVQRLLI